MKRFVLLILVLISACKSSAEKEFERENEQLKSEFKVEFEKFVKANSSRLTDQQMLIEMDRISEEYFIHKNKKLAAKYVDSKRGLKRLNFLKDKFSKTQLIILLGQVSDELHLNPDYLEIKDYIK